MRRGAVEVRGVGFPEAGVTGSCERPDLGSGV